ncbi:alcohol dehydrogenase [Schizothecium vesticola]|uniref:Alcohol dehydrogenase n=1 Tax=Schizothecium vesticola TaxID=314040 RepID=A0AA40EQ33_9PEZI|nr:alcohol dehydrogenase [Schizothecium vesticola]
MRSLAVRQYSKPSGYEVLQLPVPTIERPGDILIRVHAASIQTGDTQIAAGMSRLFAPLQFPAKLCGSGSGIIVGVGSAVSSFKVGDAVYGLTHKHGEFPPVASGFASEFTVVPADTMLPKPPHVSFEDAAALAGSVLTSYQVVRRYFELTGQPTDGSATLEGKTVFLQAALGGSGSVAAQVVKNVYGASKVITTVSTAKVPLVEELLPDVVDQVVDYKTQDVVEAVGRGTVDFVFNTQWELVKTFALANPETGAVVSIASMPSEKTVRSLLGTSKVPFQWVIFLVSRLAYLWYDWKLRGTNIKHDFVSGNMGDREALERSGEWVAAGKVKAITTVVDLGDLQAIRAECQKVADGKGGVGKLVIRVSPSS